MSSRRRFLTAVGAACFVGLAGCGSSPDEETPVPPPEETETPPQERTPDETETPDGTETPTPDGTETPTTQEGVLNVLDYGAAGDGEADDTQAIQTALNDAEDGDTVYLPPGEYFVARPHFGIETIFTVPTGVSDLTIRGSPRYNNTRIFIGRDEYSTRRNVAVFRTQLDHDVVRGLEIRNLTLDGNRPRGIEPSSPSSFGLHFWPSGAGGGHDILVEDCWLENFNGPAIVCREGGDITFNRITSLDNTQNFGLSEQDDSTVGTDEYGIVVRNSISMNATLVGIDHNQGGRVKLENIYSTNNGNSGWKTKAENRETRLVNCTFEDENYFAALRTNIGDTETIPDPPVEISMDRVSVRNPSGGGIYLSGDTSEQKNSNITGGTIEIRNCRADVEAAEGGLTVHAPSGGTIDELRVFGTRNGPAVWYSGDYNLDIGTFYHDDNDSGPIGEWRPGGKIHVTKRIKKDPGRLDTPTRNDVGAWSHLTRNRRGEIRRELGNVGGSSPVSELL